MVCSEMRPSPVDVREAQRPRRQEVGVVIFFGWCIGGEWRDDSVKGAMVKAGKYIRIAAAPTHPRTHNISRHLPGCVMASAPESSRKQTRTAAAAEAITFIMTLVMKKPTRKPVEV
jgi:hypothetical protein